MTEQTQIAYVAMTGTDRPGLVSAVTARLFDLGANLGDASFAVLGTGFEFHAVCELPGDVALRSVEDELRALPPLAGAQVSVTSFLHAPTQAENARITHVIDVAGGDRPGLIARLTEAFLDYDANIVRMNSIRLPAAAGAADYVTRFEVYIPAPRAEACLAAIDNTAQQLSCTCRWQAV
jgi:glycine cleavage system transcriptional repressor